MIAYLTAEVKAIGYVIGKIHVVEGRNEEIMTKRLCKCIKETTQIYSAMDLLEKSCSFMILVQHLLDTLMLCTIVFIIEKVSIWRLQHTLYICKNTHSTNF